MPQQLLRQGGAGTAGRRGTSRQGSPPVRLFEFAVERGPFNIVSSAGLAIVVWAYRGFRLDEPARRGAFLRSGHLGRDLLT